MSAPPTDDARPPAPRSPEPADTWPPLPGPAPRWDPLDAPVLDVPAPPPGEFPDFPPPVPRPPDEPSTPAGPVAPTPAGPPTPTRRPRPVRPPRSASRTTPTDPPAPAEPTTAWPAPAEPATAWSAPVEPEAAAPAAAPAAEPPAGLDAAREVAVRVARRLVVSGTWAVAWLEGFWRVAAPWLVGVALTSWAGVKSGARWARPRAERAGTLLWRAHRARLDGLNRVGVVEALVVFTVLTGAATALVQQHVQAYRTLSPVDEIMHLDATIKAPRAVPAGEYLGEQAMRAAACRRIDSPYGPPPCETPVLEPAVYPADGFNTAYIHPTGYYRTTHWLADVTANWFGTDDVDSARLAGVVWLATGLFLLFLLARRLGAPPEAAAGVALLVAAWPPVWYSSSIVNPDATSLPVGAAVLYAAVAWGRSPFAVLVLPLAGWAAVTFKLTNILVVGVACGFLLLAALLREGTWRERGTRVLTAAGAAALLGGTAVLAASAIGRATNERALLPIGVFSTGQYVDELSTEQVLAQWTHFLPPTILSHAAPFLEDTPETRTFVSTVFALTGGLLVIGILAALAGGLRNRPAFSIALPAVVCMVVGGPLYALANFSQTHGYFSVSARYGYVLIPCAAAVLAAVLADRRLGRGLLVLGLALTGTAVGMAVAAG